MDSAVLYVPVPAITSARAPTASVTAPNAPAVMRCVQPFTNRTQRRLLFFGTARDKRVIQRVRAPHLSLCGCKSLLTGRTDGHVGVDRRARSARRGSDRDRGSAPRFR